MPHADGWLAASFWKALSLAPACFGNRVTEGRVESQGLKHGDRKDDAKPLVGSVESLLRWSNAGFDVRIEFDVGRATVDPEHVSRAIHRRN